MRHATCWTTTTSSNASNYNYNVMVTCNFACSSQDCKSKSFGLHLGGTLLCNLQGPPCKCARACGLLSIAMGTTSLSMFNLQKWCLSVPVAWFMQVESAAAMTYCMCHMNRKRVRLTGIDCQNCLFYTESSQWGAIKTEWQAYLVPVSLSPALNTNLPKEQCKE